MDIDTPNNMGGAHALTHDYRKYSHSALPPSPKNTNCIGINTFADTMNRKGPIEYPPESPCKMTEKPFLERTIIVSMVIESGHIGENALAAVEEPFLPIEKDAATA